MIQVFLSRWTPLSSSFPSSFVKLKTSKSGNRETCTSTRQGQINRRKTNKRAFSSEWMNRLCYRIMSGYWKSLKRAGRRLWSSVETWVWSPSRSPPKMFLTRFWPVSCLCGSFLNRELVLQVRLTNYRKKQSDWPDFFRTVFSDEVQSVGHFLHAFWKLHLTCGTLMQIQRNFS